MSYRNLLRQDEGGVAVVTVNRPEKLNALDEATIGELHACFAALAAAPEVRAVVLTGAGEKAFVAGADVAELSRLSGPELERLAERGQALMWRIENLGKPVLAAVNGYALGGGFEIALACDVIVAAENAKFGLPEAKLGLLPGGGGTQRLARLVGAGIAKRLIFSGETIDAARAYELNIASEIAPKGEAVNAALALAEKILANGQLAVRMAKRVIDEGLEASLPTALSLEMDATAHLFVSDDKREGIQAFVEKRPPRFTGT